MLSLRWNFIFIGFYFILVGNNYAQDERPSFLKQGVLPKESYHEFQAQRLANAKVVWINFELLRDKGIEIPEKGLTPEFEQKLLNRFAYMVPNESDPSSAYLTEDTKTFYADRYGGNGIGRNWGSGRAGSIDGFQIKGIGVTPLVGAGTEFSHTHGGASLKESIQEAIWGEINQRELPYGGNRVAMIIDTGTHTIWPDGRKVQIYASPFPTLRSTARTSTSLCKHYYNFEWLQRVSYDLD